MVNKAQRNRMVDYLVSKLEGSSKIPPVTREVVSGIDSSFILVDGDGVVLLVDRVYPGDSYARFVGDARRTRKNVASIIFKDGKNFFRNAAERHDFKRDGLSLKDYSSDEMYRMILFRPEEIFLYSQGDWLQYFQPESPHLQEGIDSFHFVPVVFDYSHISAHERFKPHNRESERLHIWDKRLHFTGDLVLDGRYLRQREAGN